MKYATLIFVLVALAVGCTKTTTNTIVQVVDYDPLLDSAVAMPVNRVIDGDTFNIAIGRDTISVRILGMDAFEIRHDARLDSQAVRAGISVDSAYHLGQMAKAFADSLIGGKTVLMTRDYSQPNFDTYNRLLRHVFYFDGAVAKSYSDLMIGKGLALPD